MESHVFAIGGTAIGLRPRLREFPMQGSCARSPNPEDGGSFDGKQASASFQWS